MTSWRRPDSTAHASRQPILYPPSTHVEDCRLDVVPLLAIAPPARPELGALLLAELDIAKNAVQLLLGDLRALLGVGVKGIADLFCVGCWGV